MAAVAVGRSRVRARAPSGAGARGDLGAARLGAGSEVLPVVPEAGELVRGGQHQRRPLHRRLAAQSDDGTSAAKVSTRILAYTKTQILLRQSSDQVSEATEMLGLSTYEAQLLPQLVRGRALRRVGDRTAVVQHRIGSAGWAICDTAQSLNLDR